MLTSVEITNFKSIRHQKIDLERLTVFVGANGSGKTSVLEAIELADRYARKEVSYTGLYAKKEFLAFCSSEAVPTLAALRTRGSDQSVDVQLISSMAHLHFRLLPPHHPLQLANTSSHPNDWRVAFLSDVEHHPRPTAVVIGAALLARFDVRKLRAASYSTSTSPKMADDGEYLASALASLALTDREAFPRVLEKMRRILPSLEDIRFARAEVNRREREVVRFGDETIEREPMRTYIGDALLFDFKNATGIPAEQVSEGTLILLGIITLLSSTCGPTVLMLDDLDHALHPLAQIQLVDLLREALAADEGLQILATTHSPYLLDALKPEEVRLMALDEQGHSVCRPLVEHKEFQHWKEQMAPGELWSLWGEKWITAEATAP
jgi:predicted ATPase